MEAILYGVFIVQSSPGSFADVHLLWESRVVWSEIRILLGIMQGSECELEQLRLCFDVEWLIGLCTADVWEHYQHNLLYAPIMSSMRVRPVCLIKDTIIYMDEGQCHFASMWPPMKLNNDGKCVYVAVKGTMLPNYSEVSEEWFVNWTVKSSRFCFSRSQTLVINYFKTGLYFFLSGYW